MIKSLDRISYLTNSLEKAEKTFSAFFDTKPMKKVISKDRNYESMLYGFENMHFEITFFKGFASKKAEKAFSAFSNEFVR